MSAWAVGVREARDRMAMMGVMVRMGFEEEIFTTEDTESHGEGRGREFSRNGVKMQRDARAFYNSILVFVSLLSPWFSVSSVVNCCSFRPSESFRRAWRSARRTGRGGVRRLP